MEHFYKRRFPEMREYNRKEFLGLAAAGGLALAGCGKKEGLEYKTQESSANNLRFLALEGSPYNRGLIHGQELKKEISEVIKLWKLDIKENYKLDPEIFVSEFIKKTNFLPAITKHTPDLLEEIKGIADGSGIDYNTILTFQLMDEVWLNAKDIFGEHCTSLGIQKNDKMPSFIAQTMDLEGFRNGFQAVLHIKHENSNLESFVFTCAGLITTNGINNRAVGVCVNALAELNHSVEGLPVAFVIRGILEQTSQEDAIKFLHEIEHASGQNYIIGGPEKNYDFECSPNKIAPFIPYEAAEVVYHTNHPLVNDDILRKIDYPSTYARFKSLENRLSSIPDVDRLDLIKSILSSHDSEEYPICRPFKDNPSTFTFGSTIMGLSKRPKFHVAPGPPDVTPYNVYKFSER